MKEKLVFPEHCKKCPYYNLPWYRKILESNPCLGENCFCFHCKDPENNPICPDTKAFVHLSGWYMQSYGGGGKIVPLIETKRSWL
jgi:hypothetical protein